MFSTLLWYFDYDAERHADGDFVKARDDDCNEYCFRDGKLYANGIILTNMRGCFENRRSTVADKKNGEY